MAISKVLASEGVENDAAEEDELTVALASGDRRRALTILMTQHGDRIYRYALGVTGEHQLADEVRQQVFVEAHRDLDSYGGRCPVVIWLLGIARHRCLDAMKSQQRWQRRFKHDPPDEGDVGGDHDPQHDLDRHRIARMIARCMSLLAPAALEAVMLRYQQELPYNEVAELVGARVGTVQQRVARALPVLRKCIDRLLHGGVP